MAYNNVFPVNYQPNYYPQPMVGTQMSLSQMSPTQMSGTSNNTGIIWVQGEAGAKSYLVAPNTTVQLWDSEDQTIYLKSADASGMPSIKILDYKIRESNTPSAPAVAQVPMDDYVTKDEFKALEERFQKQIEKLAPRDNRKDGK